MTVDVDASEFLERPTNPTSKAAARHARRAQKASRGSYVVEPLKPKTARQAEYISLLQGGGDVFAVGGAGTGKTYIPARLAARALVDGKVEKIIVARVTVAKAKHALGFLPGKLDQKLAPWLVPIMDGMRAEVSAATIDQWKANGQFEIASFEHMRGRTFANCWLILDEAQNADLGDLQLFLTRIGEGAQVAVTGDTDQVDIHNSGLEEVLEMVRRNSINMSIVEFGDDDVVRSALARSWVKAFSARRARLATPERDVQILDHAPAFLNNGRDRPSHAA